MPAPVGQLAVLLRQCCRRVRPIYRLQGAEHGRTGGVRQCGQQGLPAAGRAAAADSTVVAGRPSKRLAAFRGPGGGSGCPSWSQKLDNLFINNTTIVAIANRAPAPPPVPRLAPLRPPPLCQSCCEWQPPALPPGPLHTPRGSEADIIAVIRQRTRVQAGRQ